MASWKMALALALAVGVAVLSVACGDSPEKSVAPSPAATVSPAQALSVEEREAGERFLDNLHELIIEMTEDDMANETQLSVVLALDLDTEAAMRHPVMGVLNDTGKTCRALIWGESRLLRSPCDEYHAILQKGLELDTPFHQLAAQLAPIARDVQETLENH